MPPIPALGLHLRPQEFISTVKYRLGVPVYDADGPCPACQTHSDRFGDHALCCGHQGERIARLNHLRDAIFDNYAVDHKMRGAAEACQRQGIAFFPLAAESQGGWHSIAEAQVKKLVSAMARNTGLEKLEAETHTWGRLGLLLQRGNAAILNNRVPSFPDPVVSGHW